MRESCATALAVSEAQGLNAQIHVDQLPLHTGAAAIHRSSRSLQQRDEAAGIATGASHGLAYDRVRSAPALDAAAPEGTRRSVRAIVALRTRRSPHA
jgi:hypothetical protein